MAFDLSKNFVRPDQQQLIRLALGGANASVGVAINGTNGENLLTANSVEVALGNGQISTMPAQAEIDLSATLAGGEIIKDGKRGVIFVVWNGSGVQVLLGDELSRTTRQDPLALSSLNKESGNYVLVPEPPGGLETWMIVAAVDIQNASGADFVIGTTLLSAAGITDTYYNLQSAAPGTQFV